VTPFSNYLPSAQKRSRNRRDQISPVGQLRVGDRLVWMEGRNSELCFQVSPVNCERYLRFKILPVIYQTITMIRHKRPCLNKFPKTETSVEKTTGRGVFC